MDSSTENLLPDFFWRRGCVKRCSPRTGSRFPSRFEKKNASIVSVDAVGIFSTELESVYPPRLSAVRTRSDHTQLQRESTRKSILAPEATRNLPQGKLYRVLSLNVRRRQKKPSENPRLGVWEQIVEKIHAREPEPRPAGV